jgi:hypothetical protein
MTLWDGCGDAEIPKEIANSRKIWRPAGLEPATPGLEGRGYESARDGPKRSRLILRPVSRVGGNCFPPQTMTTCHTCVTPQPFKPRQSCALSNRGLVRGTHANARGLHNPQPMLHPFRRQDRKQAAHQLEYSPPTGFCWSQYDDADVIGRRVGPDVREIEVESEEHARACLAGRRNFGIVRAGEPFVVDPSRTPSQPCAGARPPRREASPSSVSSGTRLPRTRSSSLR